MEISLSSRHVDQLIDLAKDSLPNESCAILLGQGDKVIEILPMQNADASAISFSIEPQEILRAYDLAESKKLMVLGIFHSHPSRPMPSGLDKRFMEINPVVWLIYSTTENRLKGFIHDDEVREVRIRITE